MRTAAGALLLAYASAHASNALLAGLVRYDLQLSPQSYGWIAAMYSTGGLIGGCALVASRGIERCFIVIGIFLLAIATAALAISRTLFEAMICQGMIGLSFALVRMAGDLTILKLTQSAMLGRVRSNIDAAIGMVAILIYLAASVATFRARMLFLALSCVFACGGLVIVWGQRKRQAKNAS